MKISILTFTFFFTLCHLFAQKISIANERMNIFYVGIDNPVSIAADGFSTKNLIIKTTNGKIEKIENSYLFRPDSVGKSEIILYIKWNGKLKEIDRAAFRSKNLPLPTFQIGSSNKNKSRLEVASQQYVRAELENFDIDVRYSIDSFKVFIFSSDTCQNRIFTNFGSKLNEEVRARFQNLRNLDVVVFKDIFIKQPDKSSILIEPLIITIKD